MSSEKNTKSRKRNYENEYPSVTEVLGQLRKIALENWFKFNTLEFINREGGKGRAVGTNIHNAIETYITTGEMKVETEYPDEVTNALKSFVLFTKEHPEIKLKLSELKMTSEKHKYNGTMDVDAEETDKTLVLIGDWKSGNCKEEAAPKIYDEHIEQLSAYDQLNQECRGVRADKGFIAVFAKDKVAYGFKWVSRNELDDAFENVFLPALKITNYRRRPKNAV